MNDSDQTEDKCGQGLIDILWDDILFTKMLPLLSLKDLFVLRGLSSKYKLLIDTYFKQMKYIHTGSYCRTFSLDAFKVLSEHCCQLKELAIPNCCWMTDDLIIPLFENNINLTKIVLNGCSGLTSVCLQPVIINCKNLSCLCLAECSWLTTGCLESITLHQHNLVEVDICGCRLIDKCETINNFLQISHRIKVLNISKLSCINDSTLSVLAHNATQLERLNISGCYQVTDHGISLVVEYCRKLHVLMWVGCPLVKPQITWKKRLEHLMLVPDPFAPLRIRLCNRVRYCVMTPRMNV